MDGLDRVASRQLALVTTGQLRALGLSEAEIEHRLRTGRLHALRRGVHRVDGGPVSTRQAVLAAQLAAGPGALVSHRTAAWLWAIPGAGQPPEVDLLTRRPQRAMLRGVRAHCTNLLPATDVRRLDGIPVTAPARTVIDACPELPALGQAVDDLLRRKVMTLRQLARCAGAVPVSGRRRIRPIRAVLARRLPGFDPGGSERELDVVRAIAAAGLPAPRQRYRVTLEGRRYELDFAYPEVKVGIEFDGWEYHRSRTSFDNDRARRNTFQRRGWSIFNLTSSSTAAEVVAIVGAAGLPGAAAA